MAGGREAFKGATLELKLNGKSKALDVKKLNSMLDAAGAKTKWAGPYAVQGKKYHKVLNEFLATEFKSADIIDLGKGMYMVSDKKKAMAFDSKLVDAPSYED